MVSIPIKYGKTKSRTIIARLENIKYLKVCFSYSREFKIEVVIPLKLNGIIQKLALLKKSPARAELNKKQQIPSPNDKNMGKHNSATKHAKLRALFIWILMLVLSFTAFALEREDIIVILRESIIVVGKKSSGKAMPILSPKRDNACSLV